MEGVNHHPRLRIEAADGQLLRACGRSYRSTGDYLASALFVPGGEALWLASNSCSVIGRVMGHGELVEVRVTGAQEAVVAAADVVTRLVALLCDTV